MDSLITVGCLSHQGVAVRMHELDDAINVLTANCPHLVVYLDAGAADAVPAPQIAKLLRRAGVAKIQGFFLNSTHFDWTTQGDQLRRADLAADRRQALRRQHRRERPRAAGPTQPRQERQRGPLQPTQSRPRPGPHRQHGFSQCRRLRVDRQPRQVRRAVPRRRAQDGQLLAHARARAGPQRELPRQLASASAGRGRVIVPHPITSSPSIRHAIWPGAATSAASVSSNVSDGCLPPDASSTTRAASGRER